MSAFAPLSFSKTMREITFEIHRELNGAVKHRKAQKSVSTNIMVCGVNNPKGTA